jgi:hypothetical protein
MDINKTFYENTTEWVQTGGSAGGYISDIEIDPSNPSILYAAGYPLVYKALLSKWSFNIWVKYTEALILEMVSH